MIAHHRPHTSGDPHLIRITSRRLTGWPLPVGIGLSLVIGLLLPPIAVSGRASTSEVRALWVLRTSLTSVESIGRVVETARTNGFNTLLVQVRGRGDAYFNDGREPRAAALAAVPRFDPLAEILARAHEAGLRVHAWTNVNLVASAVTLPASRDHIVRRHPEWLMVPRALAGQLAAVDPRSPAYVAALARWARARSNEVEGLYVSPLHADVVTHTVATIADLVERYPVDGVHLDYIRFPNDSFDFSRTALEAFRREILPRLDPDETRGLDERARRQPFVYPDRFPAAWSRFRRDRLTAFVASLRTAIKARRPEAVVSAAVVPDYVEAQQRKFQDWQTWVERGLLDVVCPMAYTQDLKLYTAQIAAARGVAGGQQLWAGIGAYRLVPGQTVQFIDAARRAGAAGVALFSYDSLAAREHRGHFATVRRESFTDIGGSGSR